MLSILKSLAATPARLAVAASVTVMVVAGGATTFGAWTVGGTGSAYAKAGTAVNLTTNDLTATVVADLVPGQSGDVEISITNPNSFDVDVTGIAGGTITSNDAGCTTTGVTFTDVTGATLAVAAGDTEVFTLTNAASMSNASVNACQGDVFTIAVTLTAVSS